MDRGQEGLLMLMEIYSTVMEFRKMARIQAVQVVPLGQSLKVNLIFNMILRWKVSLQTHKIMGIE